MRSIMPPVGEWRPWGQDEPDWGDGNRQVEVEYEDGRIVRGTLDLYEMTPGPDEAPIFRVVDADGARHSWGDHKRWRYTEQEHENGTAPSGPTTSSSK